MSDDVVAAAADDAIDHARLILETANDAFISIDEAGTILSWNRAAERTFGWERHEALGRPLAETLIPERFRAAHRAGVARLLETGEGRMLFQTIELPALRRDGSEFPAEVTIWPSHVAQRWRFNAFVRDVTERVRMQAHLELLQRVTAAANGATELETAVLAALEEVAALTGWPVGHAYVRGWHDDRLAPTGWWTAGAERYGAFRIATEQRTMAASEGLPGRVAARGEPMWISRLSTDDNFPRRHAAREAGLASALAFPVMSGERVVAVLEFYSERPADPDGEMLELMTHIGVELGRVFERLQWGTQLRQAMDERSKLLAMTAHEFGTPLVAIEGFTQLLIDDCRQAGDTEKVEQLEVIERHAHRLKRMVSQALAASQVGSDAQRLHTEALALPSVIEELLRDLGRDDIEVHYDDEVLVEADRDHLVQIVTNLLSNATAYGAAPVWIEIDGTTMATSSATGSALLRVSDRGPGVPPSFVPDLFRSFRRGAVGGSGAGLGLSIVRDLAAINGGAAWYEPLEPTGACFVVQLPLAHERSGEGHAGRAGEQLRGRDPA